MYELSVNKAKNRIYLRMEGFIQDNEINEITKRVINEVNALPTGFDLINDLTSFKPASPQGAQEIQRCVKYAYEHGLRHVMRIVGGNPIARNQFDRVSKTTGSSSVTEEVATREIAERRLDALNASADIPKPKK